MRLTFVAFAIIVAPATATAAPLAEQLYDEGQQAFDRRDYMTAIARWQSSYALSKLPLLVLNIAQAYRLSGDCPHALSEYQRYIVLDSTSDQRKLADGFVSELSTNCGPPTQTQLVEQVEKRSRPDHNWRIAAFITGGAGVAVFATGLVFGRRAVSLGDQVTQDCLTVCDWSVEKTKDSDGQGYGTFGKVLDVAGVAAIAAGIGLYIYGGHVAEPALSIQPRSSGTTVSWGGHW